MKQTLFIAKLFVLTLIAGLSYAAGPFQEGQHYTRLGDPVRTANPNKVEVVEVFSYDCPHCFAFEPLVQPWQQKLSPDVVFISMQAIWDSNREKLARAQLTARALKVADKIHPALYNAIQVQGKRVLNEKQIKEIFVSNGVDGLKFEKTFSSFGINSQIDQNRAKLNGYKVNSTPQLIIDGTYVITPTQEIDHLVMLEIADFLIAKVRAERGFE